MLPQPQQSVVLSTSRCSLWRGVAAAAIFIFREKSGLDIVWKLPSLRSHRQPATVPEGIRIYAIGDAHGRADLLALVLLQIEVDIALHPISRPITVFLGDYIDRGPASKEVLDLLLMWRNAREAVFLKGNHETFLLKFLEDPAVLNEWRRCGGLETLIAYGLKPSVIPTPFEQAQLAHDFANALPEPHRELLQTLKLSFVCGDFLFVHAGVRPLIPIHQQTEEDLLWIRDEFLLWEKEFEKIVVHGHTPVQEPDIRANRINIDTGAFATGRLTCMMFEGTKIMPLVDVRDWVRKLPDIDVSAAEPIGLELPRDTATVERLRRNLTVVAAAHAGKFKDGTAVHDGRLLVRLDPRPRA